MNASRLLTLALTGLLVTAWSGSAESARKKDSSTLGALATRSAPVDRAVPVQAAPDDAANSYAAFLQIADADPALKAQALRRLGDLRLEQAANAQRHGRRYGSCCAGEGPRRRRCLPGTPARLS